MSKITKTTTILIISIICLCLFTTSAAAATTGLWTYGEDKYDGAINNLATMNGSHIIVGTTDNYGAVGDDMWIFKVAENGTMTWSKHYGGNGNESGFNVIATTDGGYAVVGATTSYGAGEEDLWLVKIDTQGNMQWNHTYGGLYDDEGWMLLQTADGGYLITGLTSNSQEMGDGYLVKTDSAGNLQWQKTYGGSGDDDFYGITATTDNGYILTGLTNSTGAGDYDVWLVKVDSSGVQQWAKTYGGADVDIGYVAFESDTDFVVDCTTYSYGAGGADVWLLKVDAMGGLMWNYTYGGPESDHGWYGAKTTDGYALGGFTYSYGNGDNSAAWLVKVDVNGMTMWNRTYGAEGRDYYGWAVTQTSDGGYAVSGETAPSNSDNYDAFLIITDSSGNAAIENAPNTGLFLYAVAAVLIVILVVAVVAVLVLLRRKPKQPQPATL
jgi:predicted secreted protein